MLELRFAFVVFFPAHHPEGAGKTGMDRKAAAALRAQVPNRHILNNRKDYFL